MIVEEKLSLFHRFIESSRLEKPSNIIKSDLQPNTIMATKPYVNEYNSPKDEMYREDTETQQRLGSVTVYACCIISCTGNGRNICNLNHTRRADWIWVISSFLSFCLEYRLPDSLLVSGHKKFPFLNAHNAKHELPEKKEGFFIFISELKKILKPQQPPMKQAGVSFCLPETIMVFSTSVKENSEAVSRFFKAFHCMHSGYVIFSIICFCKALKDSFNKEKWL